MLAGDYNVMPTELDVYKPERWVDDALFSPETRAAYRRLVAQGWTDALRQLHPDETIYTFWDYFRNAFARNAGLRIDHLLLSPPLAKRLRRCRGRPRGPRLGEDPALRAQAAGLAADLAAELVLDMGADDLVEALLGLEAECLARWRRSCAASRRRS